MTAKKTLLKALFLVGLGVVGTLYFKDFKFKRNEHVDKAWRVDGCKVQIVHENRIGPDKYRLEIYDRAGQLALRNSKWYSPIELELMPYQTKKAENTGEKAISKATKAKSNLANVVSTYQK